MAVLAVLGLLSLIVWLVEVFAEGTHPFNFWAVVTLAILLVAAILWGIQGRSAGAAGPAPHHTYNAPVTQMFFEGGAPLSGAPPEASPASAVPGDRVVGGPSPDQPTLIRLADYVEWPNDEPTIQHRHFKNVTVRGPLVISPTHVNFVNGGFRHPPDHREGMWWETVEGQAYVGIVRVQFCTFENFVFEGVALAMTAENWRQFCEQVPERS